MRPSSLWLAIAPLPRQSSWKETFPSHAFHNIQIYTTKFAAKGVHRRTSVADEQLADELVQSFGIAEGSVVIEAWPGMSQLSRALLRLPKSQVTSLISLEPSSFFLRALGFPNSSLPRDRLLNPEGYLAADFKSVGYEWQFTSGDHEGSTIHRVIQDKDDERYKLVCGSLYEWEMADGLEEMGLLDGVVPRKWDEEPPSLHIVAQVPESTVGEQLIGQWLGCIAHQNWFFKYGRVKMSIMTTPSMYERLTAIPSQPIFNKVGVFRTALTSYRPSSVTYPIGGELHSPSSPLPASILASHYNPPLPLPSTSRLASSDPDLFYGGTRSSGPLSAAAKNIAKRKDKKVGLPVMMGITLEPRKDKLIDDDDRDAWDYCLRRMFVQQHSKLGVAILNLAPGANNLIPLLTSPSLPASQRIDPEKSVREFDLADWANLVKVFKEWEFQPEILVAVNSEIPSSVYSLGS